MPFKVTMDGHDLYWAELQANKDYRVLGLLFGGQDALLIDGDDRRVRRRVDYRAYWLTRGVGSAEEELRLHPGTDTQSLLRTMMERGRVGHFEVAHPTLHDIFVRIAGGTGD